MNIQAHSTPESRQALRNYLRNRRMTGSIHQTVTALTLNDLEDALSLLQGVRHPSPTWTEEIESFLSKTVGTVPQDPSAALPGLLDGN